MKRFFAYCLVFLIILGSSTASASGLISENDLYEALKGESGYNFFCFLLKSYGLITTAENFRHFRYGDEKRVIYYEDSAAIKRLTESSTYNYILNNLIKNDIEEAALSGRTSTDRSIDNSDFNAFRVYEVSANSENMLAHLINIIPHFDDDNYQIPMQEKDRIHIRDMDLWNSIGSSNLFYNAMYNAQESTWDIYIEIVDLYDFHKSVSGQGDGADMLNNVFYRFQEEGICTPFEVVYKIHTTGFDDVSITSGKAQKMETKTDIDANEISILYTIPDPQVAVAGQTIVIHAETTGNVDRVVLLNEETSKPIDQRQVGQNKNSDGAGDYGGEAWRVNFKARGSEKRTLYLRAYSGEEYVEAVVELGVVGYVSKEDQAKMAASQNTAQASFGGGWTPPGWYDIPYKNTDNSDYVVASSSRTASTNNASTSQQTTNYNNNLISIHVQHDGPIDYPYANAIMVDANGDIMKDENGNVIYLKPVSTTVTSFGRTDVKHDKNYIYKIDKDGNIVKDENGKVVYIENPYLENKEVVDKTYH